MVSGIVEFAALTTAAVIAMHRTRGDGTVWARVYSGLVTLLAVGYPLLGLAYLTDRLGTLVEPIFFIAFSVMLLAEVFETVGRRVPAPIWAERVVARGAGSSAVSPIRGSGAGASAEYPDPA
jgi:hypothetical protein